jgi:catechol 2,3-dioxygenase-like lactoylglutathione lyase family enzyme
MPKITQLGRVMVPVRSQDAGIAFYTEKLGFTLQADIPFGDGDRWVEVAPAGGGAALALVPGRGDYTAPRNTGIALEADDASALHGELQARGVDVDAELMGGDGTVPLMFFFRDGDGNTLLAVQAMG